MNEFVSCIAFLIVCVFIARVYSLNCSMSRTLKPTAQSIISALLLHVPEIKRCEIIFQSSQLNQVELTLQHADCEIQQLSEE